MLDVALFTMLVDEIPFKIPFTTILNDKSLHFLSTLKSLGSVMNVTFLPISNRLNTDPYDSEHFLMKLFGFWANSRELPRNGIVYWAVFG